MLAHSRCLFNWAERWLKMIEDDDLLFKEVNNIRKIKVRPDLIWFEHGWSWFFRVFLACICGAVPWAALDRPLFTSHVWTLLVETCQVVTGLYDVWVPNSFGARFFFHFGNFLIYHLRCDCEKWQVFSNQASTAWQLQLGFVCSILIANDSNSFLQVKNAEVTSSIYLYNICHYFFQWNGNYNSFTSIIVVILRPYWRHPGPSNAVFHSLHIIERPLCQGHSFWFLPSQEPARKVP